MLKLHDEVGGTDVDWEKTVKRSRKRRKPATANAASTMNTMKATGVNHTATTTSRLMIKEEDDDDGSDDGDDENPANSATARLVLL